MRTYDGFVFIPRHDHLLLLNLLDAGPAGLEPGTRRVLTKLLEPGMTFVDVGAHIGLLTLAGARSVGNTGQVFAIEPGPVAFDALCQTITISGLGVNIQCEMPSRRRAPGAANVLHSKRDWSQLADAIELFRNRELKRLKSMYRRSTISCQRANALTW